MVSVSGPPLGTAQSTEKVGVVPPQLTHGFLPASLFPFRYPAGFSHLATVRLVTHSSSARCSIVGSNSPLTCHLRGRGNLGLSPEPYSLAGGPPSLSGRGRGEAEAETRRSRVGEEKEGLSPRADPGVWPASLSGMVEPTKLTEARPWPEISALSSWSSWYRLGPSLVHFGTKHQPISLIRTDTEMAGAD